MLLSSTLTFFPANWTEERKQQVKIISLTPSSQGHACEIRRGGWGRASILSVMPNTAPNRWWENWTATCKRMKLEHFLTPSVQFSSVAQSCPTLCDPMNRSMPGLGKDCCLRPVCEENTFALRRFQVGSDELLWVSFVSHLFLNKNKSFFGCTACGILVPWPGIELTSSVLEAQSLNHWTAREVPGFLSLKHNIVLWLEWKFSLYFSSPSSPIQQS